MNITSNNNFSKIFHELCESSLFYSWIYKQLHTFHLYRFHDWYRNCIWKYWNGFFIPFGPIKSVNKMKVCEKKSKLLVNRQCKVRWKYVKTVRHSALLIWNRLEVFTEMTTEFNKCNKDRTPFWEIERWIRGIDASTRDHINTHKCVNIKWHGNAKPTWFLANTKWVLARIRYTFTSIFIPHFNVSTSHARIKLYVSRYAHTHTLTHNWYNHNANLKWYMLNCSVYRKWYCRVHSFACSINRFVLPSVFLSNVTHTVCTALHMNKNNTKYFIIIWWLLFQSAMLCAICTV